MTQTHRPLPAPAWPPDAGAPARRRLSGRAGAEALVGLSLERHDSPLGSILLGATEAGLVRVGLPAEDEEAVLGELCEPTAARAAAAPRRSLALARRQLDEYYEGARQSFDVPLDWQLTRGFRCEVLRSTALIPYGRTASYRDVATSAGRPGAFRAAGTALATNPLPIIVPCHRVVPSGGGLGGYRGGSQAKARLLGLEGAA